MKEFFKRNHRIILYCILLIEIWRFFLVPPEFFEQLFPQRPGFIGKYSPWSNFDGKHYNSIAHNSYFTYEQAFFPVYPLLIRFLTPYTHREGTSGFIVDYIALFFAVFFFAKLVLVLNKKDDFPWKPLLFFLFYPAAFFFIAEYSESLFMALVFATFYFALIKNFWAAGICAALASATRFVGIFLFPSLLLEVWFLEKKYNMWNFIKTLFTKNYFGVFLAPLGLLSYMYFLWKTYGDPLMFIHSQSVFNGGRTGSGIVLLPQVLYRYIKILLTLSRANYDWYIALLELLTFCFAAVMLYISYRMKMRWSFILFAFFTILTPTLTGSLSSMPRYSLAAFCIFLVLAKIRNPRIQNAALIVSGVLEIALATLFLRGYFVS